MTAFLPTRRALLLAGLAAPLPIALTACGGMGNLASIRFVNGSADFTSVDAYANGERVASALGGQGAPGVYVDVDAKSTTLKFTREGKSESLVDTGRELAEDQYYTALLLGTLGDRSLRVIEENNGESSSGKVRFRLLHGLPSSGAIDLFVTAAGDALSGAQVTLTAASFGTQSAFVTLDAGSNRRLRITASGDKSTLLFDSQTLSFPSRDTVTLAAVSSQQGSLASLVYLPEGLAATRLGNTLLG